LKPCLVQERERQVHRFHIYSQRRSRGGLKQSVSTGNLPLDSGQPGAAGQRGSQPNLLQRAEAFEVVGRRENSGGRERKVAEEEEETPRSTKTMSPSEKVI
jgi:hypothetical protein